MKAALNIIFVIMLLGVVAALIIPTTSGGVSREVAVTRSRTIKIVIGCHLFHQAYGYWPRFSDAFGLASILNGNNERKLKFIAAEDGLLDASGYFIDGWERRLGIATKPNGIMEFHSLGKDGKLGTKDDIIYPEKIEN